MQVIKSSYDRLVSLNELSNTISAREQRARRLARSKDLRLIKWRSGIGDWNWSKETPYSIVNSQNIVTGRHLDSIDSIESFLVKC